MVILSDGADVGSDYPLDQVVTAAVDAGVVVYPIYITRPGERPVDRLGTLAERTGGTRYGVDSIDQLDTALQRIARELRSQYLLVYRAPQEDPLEPVASQDAAVDVTVLRAGLTTRNVRSYYQ
jgi:hypothetical protein